MQSPADELDRAATAIEWYRSVAPLSVTCSISGTGAVADLEAAFAAAYGVPRAVAVSSATAGLLAALHVCGVGCDWTVVVEKGRWPAAHAAGSVLGAAVREIQTLEEKPLIEATRERSAKRIVVVSTPLADHPGRAAVATWCAANGITLVEDLAAAPFATPIVSNIAVVSLSSGKPVDALEGGVTLLHDDATADAVERMTQHPNRIVLRGINAGGHPPLCSRIHPVAAVMALHRLAQMRVLRGPAPDHTSLSVSARA